MPARLMRPGVFFLATVPLQLNEPAVRVVRSRIYGCDDCQLVCPFNKFGSPTTENDFEPRHELDSTALVDLFQWSEDVFNSRLQGSAIRRIGYRNWLRNIAVALGNAPTSDEVVSCLQAYKHGTDTLLDEHVSWAIAQHSS